MRVIRTIIFLLVVVGLIWLIVLLFSKVFTSGNQTSSVQTTNLSTYARLGTSATYTVQGPIVVDQDHRSIRISVTSSESTIELISGYNNTVINEQAFENTQAGYSAFLKGLDTLGFSDGNSQMNSDEQGQCPLRSRYTYQLTDNGKQIFKFWSTDCGTGSFKGSRASVKTLFERQVPRTVYSEFYRGLTHP
ncbi:hypothetical protein KDA14_03405 [Candidatus Saccharibacteria bacterium]|nr:hypothetical protein [Candidatus Saccharibacteria bacterium]